MLDLLVLSVAALGVVFGLVVLARRGETARLAAEHRTYRLDFPRDLTADAVVRFGAALSGLLVPVRHRLVGMEAVIFEVTAHHGRLTHHLVVPTTLAEAVTGQLRAALPGVRFIPDEGYQPPRLTVARELRLPVSDVALRTDHPEATSAALLASLHPLDEDEAAVLQWVLRPTAPRRLVPDHRRQSWAALLLGRQSERQPVEVVQAERRKLAEPLFLAVGRVGVRAKPGRAQAVLRRVVAALHILNAPGAYLKVRRLPARLGARRLEGRALPLLGWPCLLNAAEAASLLAFPIGAPSLPGLRLGACRQLPPVPEIPSTGTVIARSTFPSAERPLALGTQARSQHLYCLAPTGGGKTTLLANIAAQDATGEGAVVVFDTKGDVDERSLLETVLARIPGHRHEDVIVLDPSDRGRPVGFNLIGGPMADRELLVENVVSIFRTLYDGSAAGTLGPRSEDVLRAVLLTLTLRPGMTLTEAPRLMADAQWRAQFLTRIDEPVALGRFWQWAEGISKAEWSAATAPLSNKLRAALGREPLRLILGQADGRLDFDRVLGEGRILVVSLAKGLLGEAAASLLGALVLARLWQAILRRAALPATERRPVSIILDEFSDYVGIGTPLPDLLSQGRSLGARLVLAHQELHQLPIDTRHAVLANCRSKVVWQLSAADAGVMAREFSPYLTADDLQGLGPYEVAGLLATGGSVAPPVTGITLPLSPAVADPARLRALSRERWGRDRRQVEAAIRTRQGQRLRPAPVGRTRRTP